MNVYIFVVAISLWSFTKGQGGRWFHLPRQDSHQPTAYYTLVPISRSTATAKPAQGPWWLEPLQPQPSQPEPSQPGQPIHLGYPSHPEPSQPGQPALIVRPNQPEPNQPGQPIHLGYPSQPSQPNQPNQPNQHEQGRYVIKPISNNNDNGADPPILAVVVLPTAKKQSFVTTSRIQSGPATPSADGVVKAQPAVQHASGYSMMHNQQPGYAWMQGIPAQVYSIRYTTTTVAPAYNSYYYIPPTTIYISDSASRRPTLCGGITYYVPASQYSHYKCCGDNIYYSPSQYCSYEGHAHTTAPSFPYYPQPYPAPSNPFPFTGYFGTVSLVCNTVMYYVARTFRDTYGCCGSQLYNLASSACPSSTTPHPTPAPTTTPSCPGGFICCPNFPAVENTFGTLQCCPALGPYDPAAAVCPA